MGSYTHTKAWYESEANPLDGTEPIHNSLFSQVRAIEEDQLDIHTMNTLNARLYSNREPLSFSWDNALVLSMQPLTSNKDNVVQAVVDTLVARIGSMKPKATVYTRGADFDVYKRGRNLDKFLWGEFTSLQIHRLGRKVFRDALVFGTGFLKLHKVGVGAEARIVAERINPDEIVIDQRECISDDYPMQFHHRRLISRATLRSLYPKFEKEIGECQTGGYQYTSYRTPSEEQIVFIESWKLPDKPGGKGKWVRCIQNCTLEEHEYNHDRAPFVILRWSEPLSGFYGRSVVGDLIGYQVSLNQINEDIEWGHDLMCKPRIFIDQATEFLDTRLDNEIARIVKYRGVMPEAITWPAFNAEIYNERDRLWMRAHEQQGVSQMSSGSKMPDGWRADSSDALREANLIEDQRFNDRVQGIEEWYLDVARELIRLTAELHKNDGIDYSVAYKSNNVVKQINWSECDMEADRYIMQIMASSVLNMSPAARRDKLNFWLDRQLITPDQYKAWSGEPDLEQIASMAAASYDAVGDQIDMMLDGEVGISPDPHMNLGPAIQLVNETYLHLKSLKAPEEILTLFRTWLLVAESLMNQRVPAPADPNAAAMAAEPGAVPLSAGTPNDLPGMGVPPMMARPGELSPSPLPNGVQ